MKPELPKKIGLKKVKQHAKLRPYLSSLGAYARSALGLVTGRRKKIVCLASVIIGMAIAGVGAALFYPDRSLNIMDWSAPANVDDFKDVSAWSLDSAKGVTREQYGMLKGGRIWLLCNDSGTEFVWYKRSVTISPKRYPYMTVTFSLSPNASCTIYVKDKSKLIRPIFSVSNQTSKTTKMINIAGQTNRTIDEIQIRLQDYPNSTAFAIIMLQVENIAIIKNTATLSWDHFAIVGLMTSLFIPSINFYLDNRRKSLIDANLPTLLRNVAESGRTGLTLTRAIEVSAERDYGPLTKELRKMVAQLTWKTPFDDALKSFADRCDTLLARRAALLISEASKTGGNIQESIETASMHVQAIQELERKRRSQMRPYILVMYISFFVFLFTVFILVTSFFSTFSDVSTQGFMFLAAPTEAYTRIFFHMAVIEAFLAGLAGGKMSSGSIKDGLKHSTVLMIVAFVVFGFFV